MTHIEPFENTSNLLEDLGMFEAATHAPPTELPPVEVKTLLLATDRSNQDPPARLMADALAARLGATVVSRDGLLSAIELRQSIEETGAGLLVLPVPFGVDISQLREDSLGVVVDRLLLSAGVPILAVRQPLADDQLLASLNRIIVPVSPGEPRNALALAWACKLLRSGGELLTLEIADREVLAEANLLREKTESPDSTTQAAIERVMMKQFAGLTAAVQRLAYDGGFDTQTISCSGRFVAQALATLGNTPGLMIIPGSDDRRSNTFHRCADLILGSTYPVLVV